MLLIHQAGFVKVGEVVRYTVTYTPSHDRILPSPSHFYLKIKNTSAIPLRAAYLHGPYAIHVATYPSVFNPNEKLESPQHHGVPEFEPNLKAGGSWSARLTIPADIREGSNNTAAKHEEGAPPKSVKWIIEIASQILFSNTATVHFEMLVARDARSLDLGFAAIAGKGHGEPGQVQDFKNATSSVKPKGVYSRAITLVVEDTSTLWDKPALPSWVGKSPGQPKDENEQIRKPSASSASLANNGSVRHSKRKKVHVVFLTHGLHSNVGADMLFLKESIDATAMKARLDRKSKRKNRSTADTGDPNTHQTPEVKSTAPLSGGQEQLKTDEQEEDSNDESSDDEEVIVRGFSGNAVRTEKGIQYLGKRLAKFVLTMTYPEQPYLPPSRSLTRKLTGSLSNTSKPPRYDDSANPDKTNKPHLESQQLPYKFTKISFIGHSLGGLVQMYAIAYIQRRSPGFFAQIKPENFICMATPLLGLSNENPLYIKFALDFGLVGRTGQDLGLTWRAPTLARSGWNAMFSGFGASSGGEDKPKQEDPRSKPLLRILPTGPAHQVLRQFRNRTVYSNAVNDGIVPLRTSCLLFLDWRGLGRVDNARRENGLISTMAQFGWAELTGSNTTSHKPLTGRDDEDDMPDDSDDEHPRPSAPSRSQTDVPQPSRDATRDDTEQEESNGPAAHQFLASSPVEEPGLLSDSPPTTYTLSPNPLSDFLHYLRPGSPRSQVKAHKLSNKMKKTYRRAQTVMGEPSESGDDSGDLSTEPKTRPVATRGDSMLKDPNAVPPPKTSIFDAAADILNPPVPTDSWITDPASRNRTIFHDRIYHPHDIPPPPARKPRLHRSLSNLSNTSGDTDRDSEIGGSMDSGGMRVEEKIARAYHRDLSWRKVLVRLEPDAHNNMIVRRMFANAYGWDVVKHVCDTHFADTYSSNTRDENEGNEDRARGGHANVKDGEQVIGQTDGKQPSSTRSENELLEIRDELAALEKPKTGATTLASSTSFPEKRRINSMDSADWNALIYGDSEKDEEPESEEEVSSPFQAFKDFWTKSSPKDGRAQSESVAPHSKHSTDQKSSAPRASDAEIAGFLSRSPDLVESHRGLGVIDTLQRPTHPTADATAAVPLTAEASRPAALVNEPVRPGNSTADVGLQKPAEAHIRDGAQSPIESRARGNSISKDVAALSLQNRADPS